MNNLDLYFPHTQYYAEDCIIIPISQITNFDVTITSMSADEIPNAEMTLTVVGRRRNNDT